MKMNERGVSEAVGFILILGTVITGIGLVTLYGYPVLLKEQSNADVKSMERAMIVIQNDMKSLCFKNVPYKETSFHVSGGAFEVIDSSVYEGSIEVTTDTGPETYSFGALIYRSDRSNEVITLENGAVMIRQEGTGGSAMLAEPRWFYDDTTGTFVIYIMNIAADTQMAKTGMATVRMSLESVITHPPLLNPASITVKYESDPSNDYSTAWENYLTGSSVGMDKIAPGEYGWDISSKPVKKLVIKEYKIRIHNL